MKRHLLPCILGVASFAAAANINLAGTVLDNTGKPLQGVKLSLKSSGGLATTNADGTWSLVVAPRALSISGKSLRQRTATVSQHLILQGGRLRLDLGGHDLSGRSSARAATPVAGTTAALAGARTQEAFEVDTLYYVWKGVIIKREAIVSLEALSLKSSIDTARRNAPIHDARKTMGVQYRNGVVDSIPTLQFGNLTWMAQNLNYRIPGDPIDLCLDGSTDNCARYGRLYTAAQALYKLDSAKHIDHRYDTLPGYAVNAEVKVDSQGVCPTGWRLPTASEWSALLASGAHLSSAWKLIEDAVKDSTGMNIGPSGRADRIGDSAWIYSKQITSDDPQALFWSSSPYQDQAYTGAWIHRTENGFMEMLGAHITWYFNPQMTPRPSAAFSVRCVKPDDVPVIHPPLDTIRPDTAHLDTTLPVPVIPSYHVLSSNSIDTLIAKTSVATAPVGTIGTCAILDKNNVLLGRAGLADTILAPLGAARLNCVFAKGADSSRVSFLVISRDSLVIDDRDNQTYRTVRLNNQTWMVDPLRFADSGSVCDSTDTLGCRKGRFYSWTQVTKITDISSVANGNTAGVDFAGTQGLCMTGWHLPTQTEFTSAFSRPATQPDAPLYGYVMNAVGMKLPRLGSEYSGHLWVASAKNPYGVAQPILFYPESGNGVDITADKHYSTFCVKD